MSHSNDYLRIRDRKNDRTPRPRFHVTHAVGDDGTLVRTFTPVPERVRGNASTELRSFYEKVTRDAIDFLRRKAEGRDGR